MWRQGLANMNVEPCIPFIYMAPTTLFDNIVFNEDLRINLTKHSEHPELLRQLAFQVIGDIPDQALKIYTDGNKMESGRTGNSIFLKSKREDWRHWFRNSVHSSVFLSRYLALETDNSQIPHRSSQTARAQYNT
ncbi:hypothetical protein HNY73_022719 [Argiope bruennichi]|uniref:Uncharacterized protein n=1 Tax=Argiope bruennichi TaxID=94029 RepID=A0A8T0E608_ARGBR|nr:hypothetical protein HNY73_022719 [Argiope bruennichi]